MNDENHNLNKYKLLNVINDGNYSKIYKFIHVEKNQYVAIKFDYDEISKKLIKNEIHIYLLLRKSKLKI